MHSRTNRHIRFAAAICAATLLVGATATNAEAGNIFGGGISKRTTLRVSAGFPDIEIAGQIPTSSRFQIEPRLQFYYGRVLDVGNLGLVIGADARYLLKGGKLQLSLLFGLPLSFNFPKLTNSTFAFGLGLLWPGIAATYSASSSIDLDFGLQLQDQLLFYNKVFFEIFIDIFIAVEFELEKGLRLGIRFDLGPDILADVGTDFHLRFSIGLGYEF